MKVTVRGEPTDATTLPSASATAMTPKCTDSSMPPRVIAISGSYDMDDLLHAAPSPGDAPLMSSSILGGRRGGCRSLRAASARAAAPARRRPACAVPEGRTMMRPHHGENAERLADRPQQAHRGAHHPHPHRDHSEGSVVALPLHRRARAPAERVPHGA